MVYLIDHGEVRGDKSWNYAFMMNRRWWGSRVKGLTVRAKMEASRSQFICEKVFDTILLFILMLPLSIFPLGLVIALLALALKHRSLVFVA